MFVPINGVDPQKIEDRASLFERVATDLIQAPSYNGLGLGMSSDAFTIAAEIYCFLNEAYKAARIPTGSLTKPPKQAAISALAIGTTKPIRPADPSNTQKLACVHVNGALALRIASGAIPFSTLGWANYHRIRWYRMAQNLVFPSVKPLLDEANSNDMKISSVFNAALTPDELSKIDAMVAYIEALSGG